MPVANLVANKGEALLYLFVPGSSTMYLSILRVLFRTLTVVTMITGSILGNPRKSSKPPLSRAGAPGLETTRSGGVFRQY